MASQSPPSPRSNRHVAEEAMRLIIVEYEPLPFVLDQEEALKPDAVKIWPDGNLSLTAKNEAKPEFYKRGNVEEGFRTSDHVFEDRYTTTYVHNAQMEPRVSVASWEGDKLTIYTPTQGISNCRHDMARDLGIPDEKVRVVCKYMGGGFGNKNQNQDADLIAAVLAKETGAPVKLELSRKEDFIGVHGRWPTTQYYKVGVSKDGVLQSLQFRGYSGMGPYRKNSGAIGGVELYQCPNVESTVYPVITNRAVSGNYRAPEFPQGFFGIQSMMDDVALQAENGSRRVRLEEHDAQAQTTRCPTPATRLTNAFAAARKRSIGKSAGTRRARTPDRSSAARAWRSWRCDLRVGQSSAVIRLDSNGRYTAFVGVTDIGAGAKTTMSMIAAEELGVPLSQVDLVWGDTDRCPFSVGESGSRTTDMAGYAVIEAARDLKRQLAEKGMPQGENALIASASPNPIVRRKSSQSVRRALRGSGSRYRTRPRARSEIRRRARFRPHHQSADGREPN